MHRLFFVLALLTGFVGLAHQDQVDPLKLDSFKRAMESSHRQMELWQDSFNRKQDSIYGVAISHAGVNQNSTNLLKVVTKNPTSRDETKLQRAYLIVGIGVVLFVLLAVLISRRRKGHFTL